LSSIFSLPAAVERCLDTFTGWTGGRVGGLFKSDIKATLSQQSWSWGLAELGNKAMSLGDIVPTPGAEKGKHLLLFTLSYWW
jgi:hypothetical protein